MSRNVLDREYKYEEESEKEREAWQTAFNFSSRPDYFASFLNVEDEGEVVNIGEFGVHTAVKRIFSHLSVQSRDGAAENRAFGCHFHP